MRAYYTDVFPIPLPAGHRFPRSKSRLLRERLCADPELASRIDLIVGSRARDQDLLRVHDPEYLRKIEAGDLTRDEKKRIGLPWSPEMVARSRRSCGATLDATRAALEDGVAVHLAGGTHHAFRDRAEGYCVFNDSVVCARTLQSEHKVRRVIVIDCDVHQGNGTAALTRDDPTVFTFSIHGERNYPFVKERSDLDVGLPDGTGDEEYLPALEKGLQETFERIDADLVVYVSGADPYAGDRLGRLSLTIEGLARRDQMVMGECRRRGLPLVVTMAGGYAREIEDSVTIHVQTVRTALRTSEF